MLNVLFDHPEISFIFVASAITMFIVFLRLMFKCWTILCKSTIISFILYVIFMLLAPIYQKSLIETPLFEIPYQIFGAMLIVPGMLMYGLIPGRVKPCPSNFDVFAFYTIAFLFYAIVIWGIMKVIKQRKEIKTAEKKQDNNVEKQTPSDTDLKGV